MDSLLANYASSDEDEEKSSPHHQREQQPTNPSNQVQQNAKEEEIDEFLSKPTSRSSKFSLPPPKSSTTSVPFSLPPPISQSPKPQHYREEDEDGDELTRVENLEKSKPSSIFSSLPQPRSSASLFSSLPPPKAPVADQQVLPNPLADSTTASKRVVQFRPPINPDFRRVSDLDDDNEDEDDEEKERKRKKAESAVQTPSVKSFLSSIPAPRNTSTLGALPSGAGTSRRSIIEADVPAAGLVSESASVEVGVSGNAGYNEGHSVSGAAMSSMGDVGGDHSNWGTGIENYENYSGYEAAGSTADYSNSDAANGDYASYGSDYSNYSYNYDSNWKDKSTAGVAPELPAESAMRFPAKRGKRGAAPEIVEVNQDELMKNRPREDQVKLTGIAFGPSYQPASAKGKPSKLHKRKHQIGSLYFDMKQKEMELAERRARGFLTKAQTQGKYGW